MVSVNQSLNYTEDTATQNDIWKRRTTLLWDFTAPLILGFGITGNTMTICILGKIKKFSATYVFFKALAVTDLAYLCIGCFLSWIGHQFGTFAKDANLVTCMLYKWSVYVLGMQTTMMLLVLCAHRVMTLLAGEFTHRACSWKVAHISVGTVVVLCAGFNFYIPFVSEIRDNRCKWSKSFEDNGIDTMRWINAVVFSVLPCAFMIINNGFLIATLIKIEHANPTVSLAEVHARLKRLTATAIVVSATFVVLTLPLTLIHVIADNVEGLYAKPEFRFGKEVGLLMMYTNSAVNFYLYIWTGSWFRNQVLVSFRKNATSPQRGSQTSDLNPDLEAPGTSMSCDTGTDF